ncbi:uncharacterized protein LOC131804292 [Musca domestica]|uniref:Uncharacterized protein LOC131804292 n=1 Tax=Musca domestica TaxID=7370 RepID=A0ABM3VB57_MUSDO|nr:uncharacterized protein LOC131804292 [Musca domestica]
MKLYTEDELLNVDDGNATSDCPPTETTLSSAAVEAALVEPIAAVTISEPGSESNKPYSSAALASVELMQTESESISVDSSAAPVPVDNPQIENSPTESGSSGLSAAPVATPHSLEESAKFNRSESPRDSSAASHKCRHCDRMHPLDRCSDFRVMNVDMRRRIVVKFNDCIRCLAKSHQARNCHSKRKCAVCNEDHHTLLHVDSKTVVKPTSNSRRRPHTDYRHRSRHSPYYRPTENAPPSQVGLAGLLSLQSGICISPTLLLKVDAFGRPSIVRAARYTTGVSPCQLWQW